MEKDEADLKLAELGYGDWMDKLNDAGTMYHVVNMFMSQTTTLTDKKLMRQQENKRYYKRRKECLRKHAATANS